MASRAFGAMVASPALQMHRTRKDRSSAPFAVLVGTRGLFAGAWPRHAVFLISSRNRTVTFLNGT
eukprot:806018-Prymnesium_polylepis.1